MFALVCLDLSTTGIDDQSMHAAGLFLGSSKTQLANKAAIAQA